MSINNVRKEDMAMISAIMPFTTPENIPLTYKIGDKEYKGIPKEFSPSVIRRYLSSAIMQYEITGRCGDLEIRVEYLEYRDFPVTEWVAFFTNRGSSNSAIVSQPTFHAEFKGEAPEFIHGNGDTQRCDGYEWYRDSVSEPMTIFPTDGTSCKHAFPYMRVLFADGRGVNIAIGWPAQWQAVVERTEEGLAFGIGQKSFNTYLKPGEIMRTPRINYMGFTGGESRARNLWRKWYFRHICPKENGSDIGPKLCLHTFGVEGLPEFTGITEENQEKGIAQYIERGMKPDIWWIDAGWYPCDFYWPKTGNWFPNPDRLPNGLGPVGKACDRNGIQLLLWFEPERVREDTEMFNEHPEWLLRSKDKDGNYVKDCLLYLGNKECREWITDRVDKIIKESGVKIYRQDFNMPPLNHWREYERLEGDGERLGSAENLHVQGYLEYWDQLIIRNPGLWIDSCASGGRRNDLETMRRAVTLHYTDAGYGNHPVKQKQFRQMFEWVPYFRSHNMSWDNDEGTYDPIVKRPVDEFAYQCAMAPALTSMINCDEEDERFNIGLKMHPVWRRAATLMLGEDSDFYPLTECRKDPHDWYAVQFDAPAAKKGFVQAIRNTLADEETFTVKPYAVEGETYRFTEPLTDREIVISGEKLISEGFTFAMPKRSGEVWFYEKI